MAIVLLVVSAIQGTTPDPDDLSSSRFVLLAETIFTDRQAPATHVSPLDSAGGNPAPSPFDQSGDNGHEGTPDEVCIPARTAGGGVVRRNEEHRLDFHHTATSLCELLLRSGDIRSMPSHRPVQGTELLRSLCRMTC